MAYQPKEHPTRTFPLNEEVKEARKNRGNVSAEKELGDYKRYKNFSKASGTWGRKNSKSDHIARVLNREKAK
jgi:hypothetical protein